MCSTLRSFLGYCGTITGLCEFHRWMTYFVNIPEWPCRCIFPQHEVHSHSDLFSQFTYGLIDHWQLAHPQPSQQCESNKLQTGYESPMFHHSTLTITHSLKKCARKLQMEATENATIDITDWKLSHKLGNTNAIHWKHWTFCFNLATIYFLKKFTELSSCHPIPAHSPNPELEGQCEIHPHVITNKSQYFIVCIISSFKPSFTEIPPESYKYCWGHVPLYRSAVPKNKI